MIISTTTCKKEILSAFTTKVSVELVTSYFSDYCFIYRTNV